MITMNNLTQFQSIKVGEIIEGIIVGRGRSAVYLDLGMFGTGIIYGKEYQIAKDLLKKSQDGGKILTKILSLENEDGYIELSANKAGQDFAWQTIKEKKEKGELTKVKILGANKGGLLAKVMNIPAFLPVSQLSAENYPKIEGGDSVKILKEIQKFIGLEMNVMILDFNPKEEKLIISEKAKEMEKTKELLMGYNVDDVVEGEITNTTEFGAFFLFGDGIEGLIHISEIAWQVVKNPLEVVKKGEKISAKIIEINNNRVFLSLKKLKDNPWEKISKKYSQGDLVKGKVTKFNPFGAFIQLATEKNDEDKIQGLCHISEFGSPEKMAENLIMDKEYDFEIISFDSKEYRMILKLIKR